MSTPHPTLSRRGTTLALATLFLGMFVTGSAEMIVVGVLNLIATDLRVSIPAAGALVTANALGLAAGGPILTALTIRLDKRLTLIGTIVLFILANLVPVLTANYGVFLAARTAAGALQGLFIAVAFAVAMAVAPPERMGRAISVVVSGVAVSAALGVPLGTLAGQALGWRGSFTAIVAVSVLALVATLALIPPVPSTGGGAGGQARYAFAPRVLAVLGVTFLMFTGLYSTLTYIVPFLEDETGISGALISVFLLAFGVATAVGSFGGGRFADTNAARTPIAAATGAAFSLLALYLVGPIAPLVALVLAAWGVFSFGMVPSLQYRVVSLAGPGGALASALPASAANVGIACGSLAGGLAIGAFAAPSVVLTGLAITVLTIPAAWAASLLKPPAADEPEPVKVSSEQEIAANHPE
ncbi:MFS transporter [Actinomadura madurae]|uniref:MFS transporter n=1 Tax=Actinomadura madurae TaxID=1993 RepID=UPI000D8B2DFA|nr:MFS transporter [Actinomadura madurae]SPT59980.1 Purine efflux pump PbuE [Actinomadura madurae]